MRLAIEPCSGKQASLMTVRTKLNLVLAVFTAIFLITLIAINDGVIHERQSYLEDLRATHARFFERLVALKGASLMAISVDYTYWDEMVSFVKTGDRQWAKENLDTALSTFDADAVWVYRPDTSLVYSVAVPQYSQLAGSVLPPQALGYLSSHSPFSHFYLASRFGPVEIRGATIQPTNDPNRKTPSRGYFLAGRVWDQGYLRDFSQLTDGEVRLLPAGPGNTMAPPRPVPWNVVRVAETLKTWDGKPLAIVEAREMPAIIADLERQVRVQFLLLVLFGLGTTGLLTFSLRRWVNTPLGLISETLKTKNPNSLDRLARDRTEFGYLATLIRKFFAQSELIAEITKRERAEAELDVSRERFRELVQNASEVVYTHDLTGRFTSLNPAAQRLLGYSAEEASGLTIQQIVAPEQRTQITALMGTPRLDNLPPSIETDVITKDGRRVSLEIGVRTMYANGELVGLQGIGRDVTERKAAESRARREAARTATLLDVASHVTTTLDLDTVLQQIGESATAALNVPAAAVWVSDTKRETLHIAFATGLPLAGRHHVRPIASIRVGQASTEHGRVLVLVDAREVLDTDDAAFYEAMNIRTAIIAPLERNGRVVGSLDVYTIGDTRHFTEDELALMRGLADGATLAISNAQALHDAQQRLKRLHALRTIDLAISGSTAKQLVLEVLLSEITTQLQVDAANILLLNPHTQTLEFAAGRGFAVSAVRHTRLRIGEGHAGQAALTREAVVIPNLAEEPGSPMRSPFFSAEGFVAYYALPLIAKGVVKGVLEIFHRTPLDPNEEWVDFLEALGGQAAIAVDGATLFDDLQRSNVDLLLAYDTTLEGWSRALDLRDEETQGHTQRVTELTLQLARRLGIPDADLVHIRRGALLHDMGKMAIPDAILRKPGPLTDEEWNVMRRHPVYAYEMLVPITYLRPALDIPYCHHEKWDGTGYPRGLKGTDIPLAARIFAVMDVWDALTSQRPYRAAWDVERTRRHIKEYAGTHFDPDIVKAFLEMLEERQAPARGVS